MEQYQNINLTEDDQQSPPQSKLLYAIMNKTSTTKKDEKEAMDIQNDDKEFVENLASIMQKYDSKLYGEDDTSQPTSRAAPAIMPVEHIRKKKKRRRSQITICLTNCRYESIRRVSSAFGMREVLEDDAWNFYWTDMSVSVERAKEMKRFQRINHFPGMLEICRKDLLARNLNRMQKIYPKEYNFFPKTWCLPADFGEALNYSKARKNKTFIIKPECGSQGRGIYLTKSLKDIKPSEKLICQVYLAKPYLVDGYKFDIRVYSLITSCDPLRIFVYNEGLVRFATSRYADPNVNNTTNVFMHLTNYAVNKHSRTYVYDAEAGSKRFMHALKYSASTFFWIINYIHIFWNFHTDTQLDREVKESLLTDTFTMLNIWQCDKKRVLEEDRKRIRDRLLQTNKYSEFAQPEEREQEKSPWQTQIQWEETHLGNYRRVYPVSLGEYAALFQQPAGSLYAGTAASRARGDCTRLQRDEFQQTKAKSEALKKPSQPKAGVKESDKKLSDSPAADKANADKVQKTKTKPDKEKGKEKEEKGKEREEKGKVSAKPSTIQQVVEEKEIKPAYVSCSYEPDPIVEKEERERVNLLAQRDFLIRSYGMLEQIYLAMKKLGTLRAEDERKYGVYGRIVLSNSLKTAIKKSSKNVKHTPGCYGDHFNEETGALMVRPLRPAPSRMRTNNAHLAHLSYTLWKRNSLDAPRQYLHECENSFWN